MLRDIVNRNVVSVEPDARISDVAKLMKEKNVGSAIVTRDGTPGGMITDRDIVVRCLAEDLSPNDCIVEDVMTESPVTCHEEDGIFDCITKMRDAKVRRMPVVDDDGKVTGVLSFGDLLAVLSKELAELTKSTTILEETEELAA
ncbi:MAG TPA: CBS domain-containing protein [Bdellovibrionota bacterium]|nr:CBS domain-containing protein [Bdellovibrionota bacterium]